MVSGKGRILVTIHSGDTGRMNWRKIAAMNLSSQAAI